MSIAKVNGQIIPLDYRLKNGESIQIITDIHRKPNPIWLSFVKTAKAKEHIRQFINREERGYFIEKGRTILNAYMEKNYGKGLDKELSILKNLDGKTLDTKQKEDVLVQLGNLSRKPISIFRSIHDDVIRQLFGDKKPEKEETQAKTKGKTTNNTSEEVTVIIGKERDLPYKLAQCCNPTPKDKIVGYIGQGIINIHKIHCENIEKINLDRRMTARWSNAKITGVTIEIECVFHDRRGLLRQITDIIYHTGLNIESLHTEKLEDDMVLDRFVLQSDDEDYYIYERLAERIRFDIPELVETRLLSMK